MFTERQIQIINASLELISDKGIQGLTIKNLSKKIGISEPAIYRHYENKIDILSSLIDFFMQNTATFFYEIEKSKSNSIKKINTVFERYFEIFANSPSFVSVIFSEEMFINEPALKIKVGELMNRNEEILRKIIEEGQIKQEIRTDIKSGILSTFIMGTLRLLIKKWQFANNAFSIKTEGNNYIESLNKILTK